MPYQTRNATQALPAFHTLHSKQPHQVHEKTILLVALPVALYLPLDPLPCLICLQTATFSMLPLLRQDDLLDAYAIVSLLFAVALAIVAETQLQPVEEESAGWRSCWDVLRLRRVCGHERDEIAVAEMLFASRWPRGGKIGRGALRGWCRTLLAIAFYVSLGVQAVLACLLAFVKPPARLPHLWPLLIAVVSAAYFCGFFVYFSAQLWFLTETGNDVDVNVVVRKANKSRRKDE